MSGPGSRPGLPDRPGRGGVRRTSRASSSSATAVVVDRIWTKPALAVLAIDATRVADASNTLIACRARQGERPSRARRRRRSRRSDTSVATSRPTSRGVPRSRSTDGDLGEPFAIDASGPAYDAARDAFQDAWDGTEPVDIGVGGSIPFIAEFAEAFPDAAILVTGSRIRTPVRTAPTKVCTWRSSSGSVWPRRCCSATSPTSPDPPTDSRIRSGWRAGGQSGLGSHVDCGCASRRWASDPRSRPTRSRTPRCLRRLRSLGSRRGRREAHLLRLVRPAAPRPGVGRHRRRQRPSDPGLQGHGSGFPGVRRADARVADRASRHRPLALLHDRCERLAQRPADISLDSRAARSHSATTAT